MQVLQNKKIKIWVSRQPLSYFKFCNALENTHGFCHFVNYRLNNIQIYIPMNSVCDIVVKEVLSLKPVSVWMATSSGHIVSFWKHYTLLGHPFDLMGSLS